MQDNGGLQERLHGRGRAIAGGNARLSLVRESGRMALAALDSTVVWRRASPRSVRV